MQLKRKVNEKGYSIFSARYLKEKVLRHLGITAATFMRMFLRQNEEILSIASLTWAGE